MNQYVTGNMIKKIREEKGLTQLQLAEKLNVSDKTISKWETGKGLPDISLIEPLAAALQISLIELLSGENIINTNKSHNMKKVKFYVCPVCGNFMISSGEALVSCCGITLPALEAEDGDCNIERIEDEWHVTIDHPMDKRHFISFIAAIKDNGIEIVKCYPEGDAEAYFCVRGVRRIFYYCNQDGLFQKKIK